MSNENEKRTRVLVFPVGKAPYEHVIEGETLAGLQGLVGGYIERIALEENLDVYFDEEFLFKQGLDPNRLINGTPIHGPIVVARANSQGETVSVTDEDIARWSHVFPVFVRLDKLLGLDE